MCDRGSMGVCVEGTEVVGLTLVILIMSILTVEGVIRTNCLPLLKLHELLAERCLNEERLLVFMIFNSGIQPNTFCLEFNPMFFEHPSQQVKDQ